MPADRVRQMVAPGAQSVVIPLACALSDCVHHAAAAVPGLAELASTEPKSQPKPRPRIFRRRPSAVRARSRPRLLPSPGRRASAEPPVAQEGKPPSVLRNLIPALECAGRRGGLSTLPCCACNTSISGVAMWGTEEFEFRFACPKTDIRRPKNHSKFKIQNSKFLPRNEPQFMPVRSRDCIAPKCHPKARSAIP